MTLEIFRAIKDGDLRAMVDYEDKVTKWNKSCIESGEFDLMRMTLMGQIRAMLSLEEAMQEVKSSQGEGV